MGSSDLCGQLGRPGLRVLVDFHPVLEEAPCPVDHLGPGFDGDVPAVGEFVLGQADEGRRLPDLFSSMENPLFLMDDGIVENAADLGPVAASTISMQDD